MLLQEIPKPSAKSFRALLGEYITEREGLQLYIDNEYFDLEQVKSVELLEMLLPFKREVSIKTLKVIHKNSWKEIIHSKGR